MSEHTPLPWVAYDSVIMSGGRAVAYCGDELRAKRGLPFGDERDANTAYIVRACNLFPRMVEMLDRMQELFDYDLPQRGYDLISESAALLREIEE
jgi:hypothetical protein